FTTWNNLSYIHVRFFLSHFLSIFHISDLKGITDFVGYFVKYFRDLLFQWSPKSGKVPMLDNFNVYSFQQIFVVARIPPGQAASATPELCSPETAAAAAAA
ncbi:hypothetical protein ACJX0J_032465, partial [Zea mays]